MGSLIHLALENRQHKAAIDEAWLLRSLQRVLEATGVEAAQISVVLVDDAEMQRLNRDFLGHDWPTDVLSFNYGEQTKSRELDGELVLSVETAAQQALIHGWSLPEELLLYGLHGCLHLLGYDDQTEADRAVMRQKERELLNLFGLQPSGWEYAAER